MVQATVGQFPSGAEGIKDFALPVKELHSYDTLLFQARDWHFKEQRVSLCCSSLNCRVSLLECFLNPVELSPEIIRNYLVSMSGSNAQLL